MENGINPAVGHTIVNHLFPAIMAIYCLHALYEASKRKKMAYGRSLTSILYVYESKNPRGFGLLRWFYICMLIGSVLLAIFGL